MDILKLYQDYQIPKWTEGKNVSAGWVNVQCPFCGDDSNHLGFNLQDEYFKCWKCGWHPIKKTLSRLLGISEDEIFKLIIKYGGHSKRVRSPEPNIRIGVKKYKHPGNVKDLEPRHRRYLTERLFDPDQLVRDWHILGTGPVSLLDKINYSHRVLAPIYWDGREVSFQSRDITDKHRLKYLTCPKEREIIHHKNIVYGWQPDWYEKAIVVEGITDVWRLGSIAVATFGIEFTSIQAHVIASNFEQVGILFDYEDQAQAQAEKLMAELKFRKVKCLILPIENDPASMKQDDADYLVKQFKRGRL
jgi:hypothetical protein